MGCSGIVTRPWEWMRAKLCLQIGHALRNRRIEFSRVRMLERRGCRRDGVCFVWTKIQLNSLATGCHYCNRCTCACVPDTIMHPLVQNRTELQIRTSNSSLDLSKASSEVFLRGWTLVGVVDRRRGLLRSVRGR